MLCARLLPYIASFFVLFYKYLLTRLASLREKVPPFLTTGNGIMRKREEEGLVNKKAEASAEGKQEEGNMKEPFQLDKLL